MSETNIRTGTSPGGGASFDADEGGVKGRVRETASGAQEAGAGLVHEAKDKASDVAGEAASQTRRLADQARHELRSQAETQQHRLAEGLHTMGSELGRMADASDDPGYATDLVRSAADASDRVARWFDQRDPGSVLADVQDFARRRPGAFLAIAAGAGLVLGRLARGMRDAASGDASRTGGASPSGEGSPGNGSYPDALGERASSAGYPAGGYTAPVATGAGADPLRTPTLAPDVTAETPRSTGEPDDLGGGLDVDRP